MAELKTAPNGLEALLPLLLQQSSGTTQTQTGTANTGQLQQVFDKASRPMDQQLYANLIASIFQSAQQNVPSLTAALANATGSRSSNNSPLALALNEQNNQAAKAAAAAILQQQNTQDALAGNAASGIAQATRGTQTKETKQAGGPIDPLTGLLGGFALNKLDKSGMFDSMFGRGAGAGVATNGPDLSFLSDIMPSSATGFGGVGTDMAAGSYSPMTLLDSGGMGGGAASGFFDSFSMPDVASFAPDVASFLPDLSGAGDWFSDIGSGISNFFGFADGGMVGQSDMMYADGGTIRNYNNMGGPRVQYGMGALNPSSSSTGAPSGSGGGGAQGAIPNIARFFSAPPANFAGIPGGSARPTTGGMTDYNPRQSLGGVIDSRMGGGREQGLVNNGLATLAGFLAPGIGGPLASLALGGKPMQYGMMGLGKGLYERGRQDTGIENAMAGSSDPLGSFIAMMALTGKDPTGIDMSGLSGDAKDAAMQSLTLMGVPGTAAAIDTGAGGGTSGNAGGGGGSAATSGGYSDSQGSQSYTGAGNTGEGFANAGAGDYSTAGMEAAFGGGGNAGGLGNFSNIGSISNMFSGGGGNSWSGGGYGGGGGWADGGMVRGKGTGTSDSIPVRSRQPGGPTISYSDGEFVIPADVVARPGMREHFEMLINSFHQPVRR